MVECDLAKVEVAGSNPVSRSISTVTSGESKEQGRSFLLATRHQSLATAFEARYPSGKGEVCKTFTRGFDSHPRLQTSE